MPYGIRARRLIGNINYMQQDILEKSIVWNKFIGDDYLPYSNHCVDPVSCYDVQKWVLTMDSYCADGDKHHQWSSLFVVG